MKVPGFRTDIQALRGVAILLVVAYHSGLGFPSAGYLGVDIFFVVSGFLITGIVAAQIANNEFTFGKFYFRRAKRLLPAAYVVFLATAAAAILLLNDSERWDFSKQLIGAVTFTGNIALWLQSGYFQSAAETKPLLHVWSLGIEEQYYLLLPALMCIVRPRYWLFGAALVFLGSLMLSLIVGPHKPSANFYLLPFRAWELAIGSIGALAGESAAVRATARNCFWPALVALASIPMFSHPALQPGLETLVLCAATTVVLVRQHPLVEQSQVGLGLARIGDFSYSLYLVHWPLFAFASSVWIAPVPTKVRLALAFVSIALGYALFRLVERPIRRSGFAPTRRIVVLAVTASAALVAVGLWLPSMGVASAVSSRSQGPNYGLSPLCDYGSAFFERSECRSGRDARMFVWGDSFAMHLLPGIAATANVGVVQGTKSVCGPFVDAVAFDEGEYGRVWAEECLAFNRSVIRYLEAAKNVDVVVLSSPFVPYVGNGAKADRFRVLVRQGSQTREFAGSVEVALGAMRETILQLRSMGKRVIVVGPPPAIDFSVAECLERRATGKLIIGPGADGCDIPASQYRKERADVLEFMDLLPEFGQIEVVRLDRLLCSADQCATSANGDPLYAAGGHLSVSGSRFVAQKLQLGELLYARAR